jgi:hypothetical protein
MSAAIALVVYASCAASPTIATPLVPTSPVSRTTQPVSTVHNGTLNHFVYLPLVRTSPPALSKVYWGALVDGQAPSTTNMQPGGVFDVFETRAQKKMSILHWGQPWKMNGSYQSF